jgi:hypothetical protein
MPEPFWSLDQASCETGVDGSRQITYMLRAYVAIVLRRVKFFQFCALRGALAVLGWKTLLAAFFGSLLLAASFAFPDSTGEHETFRRVVAVRHSAVTGAPQAEASRLSWTMVASYQDYSLAGYMTASGEPFDPEGYTAAHRTLPLGTRLLVSYGGRSVEVTVIDRGPYVAGYDLDLSLAAAREIGLIAPGSAPVRVILL